MLENLFCPNCGSANIMYSKKRDLYICEDCNNEFNDKKATASRLRIFLSYGHDQNEELVRMIKSDLEKRGHDVWFDKSELKELGIKPGDDWRRAITDGIVRSDRVVSFLSKHSTRNPGVCLDEISIAIGVKGGNIQTILVESETEIKPPPSISYIQWLDMHDWKEKKAEGTEKWEVWYKEKFNEIVEVIESDESRRFAGEIEKLSGYLKPISSDSRISQLLKKGFVGRQWVLDEIEEWRTGYDRLSRLFWILGNPGVGKSAIMAHLSHFGKDKVIAAQFCEYDKPDHRNPSKIICSLVFQLAARLPDYRKLLLTLPEINKLDGKGESELFEYLISNPLNQTISGGRERYLILIDALDEAKEGERNPLVEMLARHAPRIPEWLCMVVTSRSEKNVTDPLQSLNPFVLDTDSEVNREDIRQYLRIELKEHLISRNDGEGLINQILDKSEGVFLYVERIYSDIRNGDLSLDRIGEFPKGLRGIYFQYFQRQFPDPENFRKSFRPPLNAIIAAQESLPVSLLGNLFNWRREELNDFVQSLGSLFQTLMVSGEKVIKHFHKSVYDWITDESTAGTFFIDIKDGDKLLSDFGWQQYLHGPDKLDSYFVKWLPRHLLILERWDDLVNILCDLDFIQVKASAKLTFHLIEDFNLTLNYIPDNVDYIKQEKARQARLDIYTRDLIACAECKISRFDLEVPESITPWPQDKIDAEIERIRTNPTRLDQLKDFRNFLGQEANNLQSHTSELKHISWQQAWNFANDGPVGRAAEKLKPADGKTLLRRSPPFRLSWNPLPQALQTLKGHTSKVNAVAITANGKRAISGSDDKTCIVWDLQSGEALQTLKGHSDHVYAVAITADGKRAISGSDDKTCIVWDLHSGEALQTLKGHTKLVYAIAITADGKRAISGSWDNTCIVWDLQSGEALQTLKGHTSYVNAVAITADGKRAISGSRDETCIVWDLQSGEAIQTMKGHTSNVNAVAITADGKRAISGSSDKTCIVWDLKSGEALQTFKGHTDHVYAVSITADGKRAISGSRDKTCIVWELQSGEALQTLKGHTNYVNTVAITANGKRAISGSYDRTCIVWDLQSGEAIQTPKGHTLAVEAIAITADGKQAISGSRDGTCILWDLQSGEAIQTLQWHTGFIRAVAVIADGKRAISGSRDKTCIVWDLQSGETLQTLKGHTSYVNAVAITSDGKRAISGSWDETCIVWDLQSGEALQTLQGHTDSIKAVAVIPDGKRAISGSSDKTCIVWDLKSGEALQTLKGHSDHVYAVAITADGKRAISGSDDRTCIVWDLQSGKALQTLKGHTSYVNAVAITADGKRAISGSGDKTCIVWDLQSVKVLLRFVTNSGILAVSIAPDGIFLGCETGEVIFLNAYKGLLNAGVAVTTIRQIWDFEFNRYLPLSADCPLCGHRFTPPTSVLATIENITKKASLKPEQSPCLELPDEAWEDPGLLGNCPKCGAELKFNPFIAGGDY